MKNYTLLLLFCSFLLTSCKTYTVAPEKFKEQIIASHQERKETSVNNPMNAMIIAAPNIKYTMNSIKYLNVYAKDGSLFFMQNSPSVEMRVTLKNGKKKYFYLDTVFLENDTLKGSKSRILALENAVPFSEIVKIEVQDGGKKYQYQ